MPNTDIQSTRLRCEYFTDPLGLGESKPRLSWILDSNKRNQAQSAYQILVADSEECLNADKGTLWDSGKVVSNRSVNIIYEGTDLRSRARCYWKVRSWDSRDHPSSYSESASWEIGLLHATDWEGKWIGLGEEARSDSAPPTGEMIDPVIRRALPCSYLHKQFEAAGTVSRARLYATAQGLYELYLNGNRVGDHVFAPGWTDYNNRIQYQTYDVTKMLVRGENVFGAILGEGWFAGYVGMDPKRKGAHYGDSSKLLAQLELEFDDGSVQTVATDGSWTSSTGPIRLSDLLMGETCDARERLDGWDRPGFDDSGWHPVTVENGDDIRLVAQIDPPIRVTEEIEAKAVTEPRSGVYVFDMGQNMVGWARLRVQGEAGTQVRMRFAEVLNPDGTIYTANLRTARSTDTYILEGGGEEVYEPRFTFHGFRYVEVTGYPGEPLPEAITGRVIHSDTLSSGTFECSNPMVNQLQQNIVWGQRGNFLSVPTDCPQRDERLGWLGDAQVFIRNASYNMDVSSFFTKWMIDVEDAQSPEGAFPNVAPRLAVNTDGAPAWGDAGIIVPWTVYKVYDDTRIVERHYEAMSRWMSYLRGANPNLLRKRKLSNNYGDWLSPGGEDSTPKDLLATAYWAYDAKLMAEMARAIGRDDEAGGYEELYEAVKKAFNEAYVAPNGRVKGDTQTCYVLALHMGLLPDEQLRAMAVEHLVKAIEEKGWHLSTGFVGVSYLCPVLSEAGRADVAYRLLLNETFPSWGYTIKHGATTIWERWDAWTEDNGFQSPNMNSFNHYSLGSVGEWLYRYVAGIGLDSQRPGYGCILIRPYPGGGLTNAKAEYDSIHGRIESSWEITDDSFRLRVVLPANTTAAVHLPIVDRHEITEGGKPAEETEGVEYSYASSSTTVFEVKSGEYEFVGPNSLIR